MFGHHDEPAKGKIIDSRIVKYVPVGPGYNETPLHEFVVDVTMADGETFRTSVTEPHNGKILPPDVGDVVGVKVNTKTKEVTFDEDDPNLNTKLRYKAMKDADKSGFDALLNKPPGTL